MNRELCTLFVQEQIVMLSFYAAINYAATSYATGFSYARLRTVSIFLLRSLKRRKLNIYCTHPLALGPLTLRRVFTVVRMSTLFSSTLTLFIFELTRQKHEGLKTTFHIWFNRNKSSCKHKRKAMSAVEYVVFPTVM